MKKGQVACKMMATTAKTKGSFAMIFEHIEQLKQQFTDKYVVVDLSRPELQRFRGLTGAVKTVNMSGRALVQFDGYNNIGWYDIDPAYLTVVPPPAPKPAETKKDKAAAPKAEAPKSPPAGEKPIGEKKTPAAAPAAAGAAAKPAPGGKGMSMADILAAARNKGGGAAPAAPAKAAAPVAEKPAAPAAPAAAAPAKAPPGGKGMTMEQILAMARGKKAEGGAPAAAAAAPAAPAPVAEPEPVAQEPAAVSAPEPVATTSGEGGRKSKKDEITTVAEQVAYCRKVDAKG